MGKGLVGYILLIGCLIPLVAGVPFALGVLPPASSVSAVPIFMGASPSLVVSGPSGSSGTTSLLPTTLLPPVSSGVTPSLLVPPQGLPSQSGLSLSLSSEPVPARLVQRIQGGHFVEMRDLLGDNIALTQHFELAANYFPTVLPSSERPRLREVSSLPSWVYCFLTYLAVLVQDQTVRDRLVYARLIVREALCHGGRGWLDYDRLFWQQAALDPSLHWGSLYPSLMASTVLSQRSGTGSFCGLCQGCDHTSSDCAMTFLRHPVRQGPPSRSTQICLSWNDGRCAVTPGPCFRLHVCATCGSPHHRANECRDTPPDSRFKNPSKRGRFPLPPPRPTPGITLRLCGTPCRIGDYVLFSITLVF